MKWLTFVLLISCQTTVPIKRRKPQELNLRPSITNMTVLPGLPKWANFSKEGQCIRTHNAQYLAFDMVNKYYRFDYQQILHLQYIYNVFLEENNRKFTEEAITERLFAKSVERVKHNLYLFKIPAYKKISIYWIDFLEEKKLKNLLKKRHTGYPIFLSLCLSRRELLNKLGRKEEDEFQVITHEFLSVFNQKFDKTIGLKVNLNSLLKEKQILFYSSTKEIPASLQLTGKVLSF